MEGTPSRADLEARATKVFELVDREEGTTAAYRVDDTIFIIWPDGQVVEGYGALGPTLSEWELEVRPTTARVWSNELDEPELLERLTVTAMTGSEEIEVNGGVWTPNPSLSTLIEEGNEVFRSTWDHGGPLGSHASVVYEFNGRYYSHDPFADPEGMDESVVFGPYESLDSALTDEFLGVSSATVSVSSSELSYEELVERLKPDQTVKGEPIRVNDREWVPTK